MSNITTEQLRNEIYTILKAADLSVISAKKVREQVEENIQCSLLSRKKEFDRIVMDFINQQQDDEDEDSDDDEEENGKDVSEPVPSKKRSMPSSQKRTSKPQQKKKRKSINVSDSGSESDGGSDSDYKVAPKAPPKKKAANGGTTTGARKSTGFTRAYNLSPELAELMGATALPRHEVVKKVWALIKERNLYDPKNKQFAICDDELMKVMKVKRFRTFGMLKHLKTHFLD